MEKIIFPILIVMNSVIWTVEIYLLPGANGIKKKSKDLQKNILRFILTTK